MEKKIVGDLKPFFNILRDDEMNIVNDSAVSEIINLFVFYMLDANINKGDIEESSPIELNIGKDDFDESLIYQNLDENVELKNILNNYKNLDGSCLISNEESYDLYVDYLPLLQFENFKKVWLIHKEVKNDLFGKNSNEKEEIFKNACIKHNLEFNDIIMLKPIVLYDFIMVLFASHKHFKNIFDIKHKHFKTVNTLDKLILALDKFNVYKINHQYDFIGALYESLYTDYFFGSIGDKNSKYKQGMGQFFTPKKIDDLLIMLCQPKLLFDKKSNKIIYQNFGELSMGTGGIIRSFIYYNKLLLNYYIKIKPNDDKYINAKKSFYNSIVKYIFGCEIDPLIYGLCMANLIIRTGNIFNNLHLNNTILYVFKNYEQLINTLYLFCINPPFSITIDFENLKLDDNKLFNLDLIPIPPGGKNSQWVFLLLSISLLKINGKGACILPDNAQLNASTGNYHLIRKLLCYCCDIHKIIRCKKESFTSTKSATIILFFTKKKDFNDVLSYELKKGYSFDDDNFKIVNSYKNIKNYIFENNSITNNIKFYNLDDFNNVNMDDVISNKINIDDIKPILEVEPNNNYSFSFDDYLNKKDTIIKVNNDIVEYKKISEIIEYGKKSKRPASDGLDKGKYNFYASSDKVIKKCNEADYTEELLILGDGGQANIKIDKNFSCSDHNILFKSKDENILLNKYLFYYLKFNKGSLNKLYTGHLMTNISKKDFNDFEIPIISLEKQEEIINFIEDEIITEYNIDKINKLFDNTNIFNYLLKGDLETFKNIYEIENEIITEYNIEKINKLFDNTIKSVIFKFTNECKDIKKLNKVYNINTGSVLKKSECKEKPESDYIYPVMSSGELPVGYYNKFNTDENKLLMSRSGSCCGRVLILNNKCFTTNVCYTLSLLDNYNNKILDKYTYYYLKSINKEINNLKFGTIIPNLNIEIVNKIEIPIIPLDQQQELIKILDETYEELHKRKYHIDRIIDYLKSLNVSIIDETKFI